MKSSSQSALLLWRRAGAALLPGRSRFRYPATDFAAKIGPSLGFKSLLAILLALASSLAMGQGVTVEPGVSLALAQERKARLSSINYRLSFQLPASEAAPIPASEVLTFALGDASVPLQLDFRESPDKLLRVRSNGRDSAYRFEQEHLIIPAAELRSGSNTLEIDFIAGDSSLNRNPEFLYTLFVPDRARTVFPVFDQPDLKATWELTLEMPSHWEAIANAPLAEQTPLGDGSRKRLRFARSDLISSYLFSFVAGEFERITRRVNGREIGLLHRESDPEKVARNLDAVFELHGDALEFLERYTEIDYPFQKFDFALIPGFQYGGMEHVGAIQYRSDSLFLDESPSQSQLLGRASLIAHETAHMWFGDLVTMEWFNDVWMKEVFANFMAAKAVNPSFPEINHELGFLLRHYPSAYAVDRSEGANPIRQELQNLNEAGTLYGNIIYNKAPVMMRQLELLVGENGFRDGLRKYLERYANGNATWPDLIAILDELTETDLRQWSEVWVNTAGRPHFSWQSGAQGADGLVPLRILQQDPTGAGRVWPQRFEIAPGQPPSEATLTVTSLLTETSLQVPAAQPIRFNVDGSGYGLFPAQPELLAHWSLLDEVERGALLVALYENLLEGREVSPPGLAAELLRLAEAEENQLLLNQALGLLENLYWTFLKVSEQESLTPEIEVRLWSATLTRSEASEKKLFFEAYAALAMSPAALERVEAIWAGTEVVEGLTLSENDLIDLATDLAIKQPERAEAIVNRQLERIENPDRRRRFAFALPALAADQQIRDEFFASLSEVDNRSREPWVLDALNALHHPLRTKDSEKYLLPSLVLLEEIQQTGDIFFPARWLSASLRNYRSQSAVNTVRQFLLDRPDYNEQLRMKILQAADPMFRALALLGSVQSN